jgi:ABC-2 type transport system permease protein
MNIFFRELRANLKSLLIWSGIVILFNAVGFSKFSAFYKNPELLKVVDSMPKAMISAFNMDSFNLTTVTGFYGIMIMYFGLILSIAAAMWGSDIISKEERDRTVEFSLTLPVKRSRVITGKLAAALVNCFVLLFVTWAATIIFAQSFAPDSQFYEFVSTSLWAFFFLQMIFLSLGIFLGCFMKNYKRAGSLAVSILLGTYFASVLTDLSEDMTFLRYVSPFKYFDPLLMLRESRLEGGFALLSLLITALALAGAYYSYAKRDLYI